jgi:polysaccharide export outer membrane protein
VAKLLERKYKRYLKYPTFNVEVLNKRAYVIGEVNKPGVIELDNEVLTVLEAIAVAGDLTDDAVKDNVIVLSRGSNGEMKMRKINLKDFDILKNTNMLIQPNDIIYVQPNDWKKVKLASNNINSIVSTFGNVVTPYLLLKGASN